jgi:hypothetical protein
MNQRKKQLLIIQPEESIFNSKTPSKTPVTTSSKQEKLARTTYSTTPQTGNRDNYTSSSFQTIRKIRNTESGTDSP